MLIIIFLSSIYIFSQSLNEALKYYQEGDFENSLKVLEVLYTRNPEDKEIKNFYIKVLTEVGMDKSFKEDYAGALIYFERAKQIAPDDSLVKDLYQTTRDIIGSSPALKEIKKKGEVAVRRKNVSPVVKAVEIKKLLDVFLKLQHQQNIFLNQFLKQNQSLKGLLSESRERTDIIRGEMELNRRMFSNIVYTNIAGILIVIFGIGMLLYLVFRNIAMRKEAVLLRYHERLLEALEKRKSIPEAEKIPIEEFHEKDVASTSSAKLKGIEVIEAELKEDRLEEKNIAKKLLKNFIYNSSYEVKEKAVRTMYKYDHNESISIIKESAKSDSRDEIIFVLNLSDLLEKDYLLSLLNRYIENEDEEIKRKVIKIIENRFSPQEIPEELKLKVSNIKEKEGWITK